MLRRLGFLFQIAQGLLQHIPPYMLWACGVLTLAALIVFAVFFVNVLALRARLRRAAAAFLGAKPPSAEIQLHGLSGVQLEELRARCNALKGPALGWWRQLSGALDLYTSPAGREGWFVTRGLRELLPYDHLVGAQINLAFYGVFPGLLTGVGLLLTFIAILLALYGVHYDEANSIRPITGIGELINGLSGKFLSSVVALTLSVLFTIGERLFVRIVRRAYDGMISAAAAEIPYLSQSRILLDIQRFAAEQTVSVSHISSEVVDRFVSAFRTEVAAGLAKDVSAGVADVLQSEFRPTMQRMGETLEGLRSAIVNLESQKQESVTGEVRGLLESLETSMVQALGKMGSDFHEALAGAASREFGNVQGTLEGTRQMLAEMNAQFGAMQTAFARVVASAESSTADQIRAGREQVEALASVMNGLMIKLQETADQNLANVRGQLTAVVSDLSERITSLSRDMMTAAEGFARQSQTSAREVLEETGKWSGAMAARLESLLRGIEARSGDFRQAGQILLQAHEQLTHTLSQSAVSLKNMGEASAQVKAYTAGLSAQTDALKTLMQQQATVAAQLREISLALQTTMHEHGNFLKEYERVFHSAQQITDGLDEGLGKIFTEISRGMRDYAQGVENNFREIVKLSNQAVPEISKLLQAQVQELSDGLEELSSVIAQATERSNGRAK